VKPPERRQYYEGSVTGPIGHSKRTSFLLALDEEEEAPGRDAFVAIAAEGQRQRAMALTRELRRAGLSAEVDLAGRGLKGQLKHADRLGARRVLILEGDGSAQLRDMESGEQRPADTGNLVGELTRGGS